MFKFKEWHRTVIIVLLIVAAVGFIIWTNGNYSANFVDSF